MHPRHLLACFVVVVFALRALAQTPLPPGEPLTGQDPLTSYTLRTEPHATDAVRFETVEAAGPGFSRAWRIATLQDTSPMASIEVRGLNTRAVTKGDIALVRFFARATEVSDETAAARLLLVVRKNGVDWNSSFEGDFSFRKEWQEIVVPVVFAKDFAAGDAAFMFRFGFKRQTLELGGLEVLYMGQRHAYADLPRTRYSYAGREADAGWRAEALARIDRIRKGNVRIRVLDAEGRAVEKAAVAVAQTRSAFQWGAALQMERLVVDSPDNRRYRHAVLELFNAASTENDLKWPVWVGDWGGSFSRDQTLAGLRWLKDHGFHTRGHVLVWPGWKNLPEPVHHLRGSPHQAAMLDLVNGHIRGVLRATKGLLDEWDVLNEPFTNHDLMDLFGPEIMPPWFKVAREEFPEGPLYFNDFSNHDATTDADHVAHFEKTTRYLIDHGAPVGGLGLQAHFNGRPNAPENILAVLDRYQAQFGLPVRITEFDVWTFDEELQADYTRDFLILCYSHPSVVGVQFWGFWEMAHWRPPAALFRADWSERPAAGVYRELVLKAWRTAAQGQTDAQGTWTTRGFHGEYVARVEVGGRLIERPFRLTPGNEIPVIEIVLPR